MKTILYIDGRNTLGKMAAVFESEKQPVPAWHTYNFKGLLAKVLEGITIDEMVFYFSKIKEHPDTKEKSKALIEAQRLLKTALEKQGFKVTLAGVVRGNLTKDYRGKETLVFKEKGVDVSIAVDMVAAACDGGLKTAVLCSSDSDLQPAIKKINERNLESIYLGFEVQPNKGLTATTKRTILIRNSEVLAYAEAKLL